MPKSYRVVKSLEKGLEILEKVAEQKEELTLSEITRLTGEDKSTVLRFLSTLVEKGYLSQSESKKYSLGFKILELTGEFFSSFKLPEKIKPLIKELSQITHESAHLAIMERGEVMFVDTERGDELISFNARIGHREPLHCTALGKALLLSLKEGEIKELVKRGLKKYTSRTITSFSRLKKELEEVKCRGYAVDDEEYKEGIRCIASPIKNFEGRVVAALGISGPSARITLEKISPLAKSVKKKAEEASRRLGWNPEKNG